MYWCSAAVWGCVMFGEYVVGAAAVVRGRVLFLAFDALAMEGLW